MPLNAEKGPFDGNPRLSIRDAPPGQILGDGQERTMREVTDQLAESFHLTDQEREQLLPSGQQSLFSNRVAWAKSHLKAAGLLEKSVRRR